MNERNDQVLAESNIDIEPRVETFPIELCPVDRAVLSVVDDYPFALWDAYGYPNRATVAAMSERLTLDEVDVWYSLKYLKRIKWLDDLGRVPDPPQMHTADCGVFSIVDVLLGKHERPVAEATTATKPNSHATEKENHPVATSNTVLQLRSFAEIEPEPVQWLWRGFLPEKFTILAGAPGTGKSTLAYDFAATISQGGRWPDGTKAPKGKVLIWSSEDAPADIILPRLIAADADLHNIDLLDSILLPEGTSRPFDPAIDFAQIRDVVKSRTGIKLVILDPIVSTVTGDMNKANDVRRALQPIVDFVSECGVSVLGISHFTKNTPGRETADRVIGSQAFGAAPRMVLATAKDRETGDCVLVRAKSNIAPDTGGFSYTISIEHNKNGKGEVIEATKIVWGDQVNGSAQQILAAIEKFGDDKPSQTDNAIAFLKKSFKENPMQYSKDVIDLAKSQADIGEKSLRTAAKALGLRIEKEPEFRGRTKWIWPHGYERQTLQ